MNIEDILKPFIYNIFHFGTLTISKKSLRDMSIRIKKRYIRHVFTDPSFSIHQYSISVDAQLLLMKHLMINEFNNVAMRRGELIRAFDQKSWDGVSSVIKPLRKYLWAWHYIEPFVKAYGFKYAVNDLRRTSKILRDPRNLDDCKVYSYIDGGYKFTSWAREFLNAGTRRGDCFSHARSPIIGISHGDQYYPSVSLAGNIASLTNKEPTLSLPFKLRQIDINPTEDIDALALSYSQQCSEPFFIRRILFFGHIPNDIQYTIPYVHFLNSKKIWEPFRVSDNFQGFFKQFRGDSSKDLIVRGGIRPGTNDELLEKECEEYGLRVVDATVFKEQINNFLADIFKHCTETSLTLHERDVLENRMSRIEKTIENYEI